MESKGYQTLKDHECFWAYGSYNHEAYPKVVFRLDHLTMKGFPSKMLLDLEIPLGYTATPAGLAPIEGTGINAVGKDSSEADGAVYDLLGRRIHGKPSPGLYIKGGKKLILKQTQL